MKKKLSIITSSIAACAIFASLFAFNGFAIGNPKVEIPTVESTLTSVKSDEGIQQVDTTKSTPVASEIESTNQNTTSDTKAVNTNTTSVNKYNASCPKKQDTQGVNNQQPNIKSANVINNLQNAIKNANCNKTTAKTRNYSALQSKLDALLSNLGLSANKPTTNTSTSTPTTSKPSTSTPTTSKPATSTATTGNYSAFQKKVLELVNVERSKNGLKPLTMNAGLSKTATLKSQDMAKLNYFDHTSPTYGSPFDMMKKYGISYRTAGENIAMGQTTPEQVMQGWMNSPGHRANILKSSFTQIGVGVAKNSSGRLYWTQQFIG
jgi:uncharacterized YkwD family protein